MLQFTMVDFIREQDEKLMNWVLFFYRIFYSNAFSKPGNLYVYSPRPKTGEP